MLGERRAVFGLGIAEAPGGQKRVSKRQPDLEICVVKRLGRLILLDSAVRVPGLFKGRTQDLFCVCILGRQFGSFLQITGCRRWISIEHR